MDVPIKRVKGGSDIKRTSEKQREGRERKLRLKNGGTSLPQTNC